MMNDSQGVPISIKRLSAAEVSAAYQILGNLYGHIPSMIIWRAWEYAAYQGWTLVEPVLDLGCGDGRFFELLWPTTSDVFGVDADPLVVHKARESGLYKDVYHCSAEKLPVQSSSFETVFANCSLEHMNNIDAVMREVSRCLRPNGTFVMSVVTNYWTEMDVLSDLIEISGATEIAASLRRRYLDYHNLVNPFPLEQWRECLKSVGLVVTEYCPIMPKMTGKLFMFIDHLWHLKTSNGEVGDTLYHELMGVNNFNEQFCSILNALLCMEDNSEIYLGAVIRAVRQ